MPIYLSKEVSDDYLEGLVNAYRNGYRDNVGEGDDVVDDGEIILNTLAAAQVVTQPGAYEVGKADALAEADAEDETPDPRRKERE